MIKNKSQSSTETASDDGQDEPTKSPVTVSKIKKLTKTRTYEKKSEVWLYFDQLLLSGIFYYVCKLLINGKKCEAKYKSSASTSNLRRHLINDHAELGK